MGADVWIVLAEASMALFAGLGFFHQRRQNKNHLKAEQLRAEVKEEEDQTHMSGEYLRRSLDAFDELVGSLQAEVGRMTIERNEARRLAESMERKLTLEIDALRREVRALRQVLVRHGIPLPVDVEG